MLKDVPAGKKPGKGGRNQEVVLGVLAEYVGGQRNWRTLWWCRLQVMDMTIPMRRER